MNPAKRLAHKFGYLIGLYAKDIQRAYDYFAYARVQELPAHKVPERLRKARQLDLGAANDADYQSANKTRVLNRIETRRPSAIWYELVSVPKGIEILDPDGWDRQHFNHSWYKECITEREYNKRLSLSTLQFPRPI